MIKRLAGGIYTWMPIGLRVLRKVENIIREEMNRTGAIELSMPIIQPATLWRESGRWEEYGPELLRVKDRHDRDFVVQPTSEEVVTDIVRSEVRSYRQLPVNFYQIQSKFRDERRPRFGVLRGREFLMKDGYSFHANHEDLQREYDNMHAAYTRIFRRIGLDFRSVEADTGSIGGTGSHEFHVLADSGEDLIAFSKESQYAANVELAEAVAPLISKAPELAQAMLTPTPNIRSCEEVSSFLGKPLRDLVKAVAVVPAPAFNTGEITLLLLRGDHTLNEVKVSKLPGLSGFRFATSQEIKGSFGCEPGFIGPVEIGNSIRVIADRTVTMMSNFICGANQADHHWVGVNWVRDLPEATEVADIRNVVEGDPSPDGTGTLEIRRGIEVGHIFQLRTRYSAALGCSFVDEFGKEHPTEMGCYGIGVSRIVGAAIEQGHDEKGIIFPSSIAPFEIAIIPLGARKSERVRNFSEHLYSTLLARGVDVLLDDRDERAGVLLSDIELIGIPHRVVIGDRGITEGYVEYKGRRDSQPIRLPMGESVNFLIRKLG